MTYSEAIQLLKNRNSKKLENNTYLIRNDNGSIGVKLHDTQVVVMHPNFCELFTGSWYTPTTKDRINNYSPTYISQKNSVWYLPDGSLFYEGVKVDYSGNVLSPKNPKKNEDANKQIKAEIKKYVADCLEALKIGIEPPSGGDCWYCLMKTDSGVNIGDAFNDHSHLLHHIEEGYIVPTLLWNSIKESGYRYPELILGFLDRDKPSNPKLTYFQSVKLSLTKYLQKRLLIRA